MGSLLLSPCFVHQTSAVRRFYIHSSAQPTAQNRGQVAPSTNFFTNPSWECPPARNIDNVPITSVHRCCVVYGRKLLCCCTPAVYRVAATSRVAAHMPMISPHFGHTMRSPEGLLWEKKSLDSILAARQTFFSSSGTQLKKICASNGKV